MHFVFVFVFVFIVVFVSVFVFNPFCLVVFLFFLEGSQSTVSWASGSLSLSYKGFFSSILLTHSSYPSFPRIVSITIFMKSSQSPFVHVSVLFAILYQP